MLRKTIIFIPLLIFFFVFDLTFGHSHKSHSEITKTEKHTEIKPTIAKINLSSDELLAFDRQIEKFIRQWEIAGASVAIAKDGEMLYAKGFGYANKETEELMQTHHLMRVASVSKLITAVAVMQLVEEDKLSLDSQVFGAKGILNDNTRFGYIDQRVEDITVKQLMNHSAGWTTRWGDHPFINRSIARQLNIELPITKDDIIRFALAKRLHYTPGTYSSYNNLGYLVLESVIEKVTGTSYESFVHKNVFHPMGIEDAFLAQNYDTLRYPLEVRYYEVPEAEPVPAFDGSQQMVMKSRGGNDIRTLGAAGGWVISSTSLLKFLIAIESDNSILSKESAEVLAKPELGKHPLGWRRISLDGSKWRTGSFAGTSALMLSNVNGYSYVFLTNSSPWVGSRFPFEVNKLMNRVMKTIDTKDTFASPKSTKNAPHNWVEHFDETKMEFPWLLTCKSDYLDMTTFQKVS